jgi:hypothetical protein
MDCEYHSGMVLKPQDLLIVLKLWVGRGRAWNYQVLAHELGMSAAEAHNGVKRARKAGLLPAGELSGVPNPVALKEFLIHGAKYAFPAEIGQVTRGIPTAYAVAPLKDQMQASDDPSPVWPHKDGTERGIAVEPLYKSAPEAALWDPALYELLALLDALRMGRARERQLAAQLIEERLK